MINQHNFDWNITDREVVIFIPNYKRKHLILPTLARFKTNINKNKWIFVVANDYHHEEFSEQEQEKYNLRYFTLERERGERNGCMIRNYFIKRCESRIMASKDPEIIIDCDDYIQILLNLTDELHRAGRAIELMEPDTPRIIQDDDLDVSQLNIKREYNIGTNAHTYSGFHFNFATKTQILQAMQGYDESFQDSYGAEDVDILERLIMTTDKVIIDKKVIAYHIWHPRRAKFLITVRQNLNLYQQKKHNLQIVANKDKKWGEG